MFRYSTLTVFPCDVLIGTGKNKLVDRLLHLVGWEREYMQLHRDTTVQSLTVTPTLIDGVISYDDSPVIKAAKNGRVLVLVRV